MLAALVLTAFLSADPGAPGRADLQRELDGVAQRIAELKAMAMDGEDVHAALQPLLVRAQQLADALDRASPRPAAPRPSAPRPSTSAALAGSAGTAEEDLRARADALFEEADGLAGELADLEARISAALDAGARRPEAEPRAPTPRPTSPAAIPAHDPAPARCVDTVPRAEPPPAVAPLIKERARLKARVRALLTEAAELDDAADRLER